MDQGGQTLNDELNALERINVDQVRHFYIFVNKISKVELFRFSKTKLLLNVSLNPPLLLVIVAQP